VLLQLSKVESPATSAGGSKKDEEYAELLKKCALHASLDFFLFFLFHCLFHICLLRLTRFLRRYEHLKATKKTHDAQALEIAEKQKVQIRRCVAADGGRSLISLDTLSDIATKLPRTKRSSASAALSCRPR
jgi:hypothetical protein